MFILLDSLIQKTKRTQPLHSPEPKMMSLFGSFVQPVVQTPQIIILISHNQVKQAIFYCSCMCLLILSCSPFSKDMRHRHQIIPWLQLPKPPNCNSYNSQLLKKCCLWFYSCRPSCLWRSCVTGCHCFSDDWLLWCFCFSPVVLLVCTHVWQTNERAAVIY